MKCLIFKLLFIPSLIFAGGDTFPNGGGLSEQAIVNSAHHFSYFIGACLLYPDCVGDEFTRHQLSELLKCNTPKISELHFATPKELPALKSIPYARVDQVNFYINREAIYSNDKPLRIPEAFGFLTRLYLDDCGLVKFDETQYVAKSLAKFIDTQTEQVTVGKDEINLSSTEWIRLRSFYSDLILEGPRGLLRLSCANGQLDSCNLDSEATHISSSQFKNLSLASESLEGKNTVHFEIVGHFVNKANGRQNFSLKATYVEGKATIVNLQGRVLALPIEKDL